MPIKIIFIFSIFLIFILISLNDAYGCADIPSMVCPYSRSCVINNREAIMNQDDSCIIVLQDCGCWPDRCYGDTAATPNKQYECFNMYSWCKTNVCPDDNGDNGKVCQFGDWCNDGGMIADSNKIVVRDGHWDATNRACVECSNGKKVKRIADSTQSCFEVNNGNDCWNYAWTELSCARSTWSKKDLCESACGAPSNCDEVIPGTGGCSLACTTSTTPTSTTTTTITSTTTTTTSTTSTTTTTILTSTTTTTITSTTTTIPCPSPINIPCSGTTNYGCIAPYDSIDSINSITVPPSVKCGNTVNIAVKWTGYHMGDSNHWGFFINNGGQFIHVGDCTSFVNGDVKNTCYNMSCSVKMPNPEDINNGIYEFWVTGSDAGGYCNPGDSGTHVESFVPITLTNCLYTAPCSQCPKRVTPDECRVVCNNPNEPNPIRTRCKCQSFQEWYLYDVTSTNFEVWINAIPTSNVDVSLYSTSDKSCPTTSSYNCFNNTGGPGQKEMCHFKLGEMDSPQYFFVNKLSGPAYDQTNNYYDIILTCKPEYSSDTGGSGMLFDVPPPPNTNDTYYKFNPIPGKIVSVTLTPKTGNDYNLYLSKSPGLYPFAEKSGTKNYVCYGDVVGYNGKEKCTFTVPNSGDYYYLVHHARGGYGYNIKWDYSCLGDVDDKIITDDTGTYKKVQLSDLVKLALAYDSKPGDSKWDPDADLNADYKVDLQDLVILALHYGWKYDMQCNYKGHV